MSPQIGRPTKGATKKSLNLQIRMNEEEMKLLDECAKRMDSTRTDVVNAGIKLVKQKLDEKISD